MDIDNLNNSQLSLLVILLTVVTSVAISAATFTLIYHQITPVDEPVQQTVVRETVNHIIEREQPIIIREETEAVETLTLDDIQQSYIRLYSGSQPVATGVYVSAEGDILTPTSLNAGSRYLVRLGEDDTLRYRVRTVDDGHSLLTLVEGETYTPPAYISRLKNPSSLVLGKSALIYGGYGADARVHSEIISQVDLDDEARIKTSVSPSEVVFPSAVFVANSLIGFLVDERNWVRVIDASYGAQEE